MRRWGVPKRAGQPIRLLLATGIDEVEAWNQYTNVEVGFITDQDKKPFTPPEDWREYSDGSFPSDVYGYIPIRMVEAFIEAHGGAISSANVIANVRRVQ